MPEETSKVATWLRLFSGSSAASTPPPAASSGGTDQCESEGVDTVPDASTEPIAPVPSAVR
ncbi:hypothetical protein SAMN05216533_4152 [Streptomyces sp. Ag109_O5-10]|nr:hypothetical protein SAMN05216533_4152 [Streptomyces sp. Ag109_O5-10]